MARHLVAPLLLVLLPGHSYATELKQMPDWHDRLPLSPALEINLDERALIIKAMEIVQAREASRREMTISWTPTLARIKSGEPITLADFIVFQGSLMIAQRDLTPEENQQINSLRHRLYKEVAAITASK